MINSPSLLYIIFSLISAGVCGVGGSVDGAAAAGELPGHFSFSSIFGLGDLTFCGVLASGSCSAGLGVSAAGDASLSGDCVLIPWDFFCVDGASSSSSSLLL